jgi:Zn-dependent protease with chaperone function
MRKLSFAARAVVALGFLFGFYFLALGLALLLVYLPYAELVHLHRVSPKLSLACLAGAFAIVRALFIVRPAAFHAPGPEIFEQDQPELFAVIRDVATQMKTKMPVHVYLIPDVNAFVAEVSGFLGFGTKRVMGIGYGLLAVDDVSNLKATLAHELGHFTGGDTRLGGVIYRTRASIGQMLASLGASALSKPFEWYGNLYLRVTFAVSRHQELEADRAGILVAGRDAHIEGLRREVRGGILFGSYVRGEIAPLCGGGVCPKSLYDGFRAFSTRIPEAQVDEAIASRETDPHDTHPAFAERIAFAQTVPDPGIARDARPAMALLRRAPDAELALEPYVFGGLGVTGALRRIEWSEVASVFYAPKLAEEGRKFAERLFPVLGAGPKYSDVARALAAALDARAVDDLARALEPEIGTLPQSVRADAAAAILGRALGVLAGAALVERGGAWHTAAGAPLTVEIEGTSYSPMTLGRDAVKKTEARAELVAMVAGETRAA